jgi:competence protein ComEA
VVANSPVRAENGVVREKLVSAVLAVAMLGGAPVTLRAGAARAKGAVATKRGVAAPEERVDINRASVAELMKVPGMTSSWAGRIVRFRPYRAKSDLLERGVLPSAVYDRIKDYVVAHREKK